MCGGRGEEPTIFLRGPTFSVKDLWPEKGTRNQDINKLEGGRKVAKQKTNLQTCLVSRYIFRNESTLR